MKCLASNWTTQHRGEGLDGKNGTGILTDRTARVCRDNKPTDILEKGGKTLYIRCIKQSWQEEKEEDTFLIVDLLFFLMKERIFVF